MIETGGTFFSLVIFFGFGILGGLVLSVFLTVSKLVKNNFIVTFICELFGVLFACLVFIIAIFKFESGLFALFELVSFLLGTVFALIFLQNLFVSPLKSVYNKIKLRKQTKE